MKLFNRTLVVFTSVVLYFSTTIQVLAQNDDIIIPRTEDAPLLLGSPNVQGIVRWAVIILVSLGIIAALIWLIIGAIKWIISGGDKEKVSEARQQIIAAIIGLVVLLLAVVILNFVVGILGVGENIFEITIPTLQGEFD